MTMPPDDFDLYKLYLETAEKVSDRRGAANQWLLSVNSAVVGLYGYLSSGKAGSGDAEEIIWRWAIPCAGAAVAVQDGTGNPAVLRRSLRSSARRGPPRMSLAAKAIRNVRWRQKAVGGKQPQPA